jgi:glutamyl-tRNA reductase
MATESGRLVALVTHARHVPSVERERFGVGAREWSAHHGGFVLETCHRVEAYAVIHEGEAVDARQIPEGGRLHVDEAVVRHAIAVAVGRDSVVVGEDQVLHQLREAVAAARGNGTLDPILERLFAFALRAGRRARSWRQGRAPSLADLAIAAIERRAGPLRGRGLLVVGSGQMGALAARAGLAAGATVSIASRTPTRAKALAVRLGGRAVPFDPGEALAAEVAGVVVALRGRWSMSAETDEALLASEAVVVDLSVPPALAEGVTVSLGQRLVSADALALGEDAGQIQLGDGLTARLETLIDSTAAEFLTWFAAHDCRATAQALTERADSDRQAELADLWRRLPQLDSEARDVIEEMSRHLAARLLRGPLERLGHDPDGRAERAVQELFGL